MKKFIKENKIYILLLLMVFLINYIKLPYYVDTAGGVIDITDRIEVDNKPKINGTINLLYVSEYRATIPTYLLSYIIPDWDLSSIKESQVSNESASEIYKRNRVMLDNSIDSATYVAYKSAGKDIEIENYENIVIATTKDTNLKIGDKILEVNNQKIENVIKLKEIINNSNVGDILNVKVIRNSKERNIEVKVYKEKENKIIGVVVITNYLLKMNPEIKIKFKDSESGSSGGLMMALSIYNTISTKDIIKGRKVAGTGTIDINGNVGEIDGIKYKIMGAANNKVDLVLVPHNNYKEALKVKKEHNYKLDIVEVNTFDEAVKYLEKN